MLIVISYSADSMHNMIERSARRISVYKTNKSFVQVFTMNKKLENYFSRLHNFNCNLITINQNFIKSRFSNLMIFNFFQNDQNIVTTTMQCTVQWRLTMIMLNRKESFKKNVY